MQIFIVDFEFLYDKKLKSYYIQEFAYYDLNLKTIQNNFIKLPLQVDFKKYWYQYRNVNHIPEGYGNVSFKFVRNFLNENAIFYVKGFQKFKLLKQLTTKKIINIDEMNCPKYSLLTKTDNDICCSFITHTNGHSNCALHKVIKLANWFENNLRN